MIKEINIKTNKKQEIVDITSKVSEIVRDVKEGNVLVYVPHATAAVIINENYDPNICDDLLEALDKIIPSECWRHDKVDNNGAAHIKAAILGPSENVIVKDGKLMLGTWQSLMLVDLDGPRNRKVFVKVLS